MLHYVEIEAFRATPFIKEPFEHLMVERFVGPSALAEINADYPKISSSGSLPVDERAVAPSPAGFSLAVSGSPQSHSLIQVEILRPLNDTPPQTRIYCAVIL